MGKKVSPLSFRLSKLKNWKSKWFSTRNYRHYLLQDIKLRSYISDKLKDAAIAKVEVERSPQRIVFNIHTSRPGIIIGRGGIGIEDLKKELKKKILEKTNIEINILEIKEPEANAQLLAKIMAEQIEKRISYRRVMRQAIERALQNSIVKGVKVMISGRLDGSEMSREEWLAEGSIPLQTFRADIDFAEANAYTTYGVVGIKVWIYKGEVFESKKKLK